jgi:hypothetical protein
MIRWLARGAQIKQAEAIQKISLELSQIYRKKFGKDPDAELIRDEAENIVAKFGPVMAIKAIFAQTGNLSGASPRPWRQEHS